MDDHHIWAAVSAELTEVNDKFWVDGARDGAVAGVRRVVLEGLETQHHFVQVHRLGDLFSFFVKLIRKCASYKNTSCHQRFKNARVIIGEIECHS